MYFKVRNTVVGVATRYRLDCPSFETRWGKPDSPFFVFVQLDPETHPGSKWVPELFRGSTSKMADVVGEVRNERGALISLLVTECYMVTFTFTEL